MKKHKRSALAAASGIVAGTPATLLNALEYHAGLTDLTYGQMGACLFRPKGKVRSAPSQVIGYTANCILLGLMGMVFDCFLSKTGRDHAMVKGVGFGLVTWAGIYCLSQKLGFTPPAKKPLAPLLSLVDHAIYGGLLGLITPRLNGSAARARNNLLPDEPDKE